MRRVFGIFKALCLSALLGACSAGIILVPTPSEAPCTQVWNNDVAVVYSSHGALDGTTAQLASGITNVWISNATGTDRRPLTQNTIAGLGLGNWPTISPDGTRVSFTSRLNLNGVWDATPGLSNNLWVMNVDGTGLTAITRNTASGLPTGPATFSSDSKRLYFGSRTALSGSWNDTATASYNLWSSKIDGTDLRSLTQNTAAGMDIVDYIAPVLDRVIISARLSLAGTTTPAGSYNLWSMSEDGSDLTPLTQNNNAGLNVTHLSITPDKTRILFASTQALSGAWNSTPIPGNLWSIKLDGTDMKNLTSNTSGTMSSWNPTMSVDAQDIIFNSTMNLSGVWNATANAVSNIWIMDSDGENLRPVTRHTSGALADRGFFSQDGQQIFLSATTALSGDFTAGAGAYNIWSYATSTLLGQPLTRYTSGNQTRAANIQSLSQTRYCN